MKDTLQTRKGKRMFKYEVEIAAAWEEEKKVKADNKAAKDAEKAAKVAKAKEKKA